jgi:hypothetical protein
VTLGQPFPIEFVDRGDTIGLRLDSPYFSSRDIRLSKAARMLERFSLSDDGRRLVYDLTVTDPATFTDPAQATRAWVARGGEQVLPYDCKSPRYSRATRSPDDQGSCETRRSAAALPAGLDLPPNRGDSCSARPHNRGSRADLKGDNNAESQSLGCRGRVCGGRRRR